MIGAVVMARRPDSFEPLPEPESMTDDGRYVDEPLRRAVRGGA